MSNNTTCYRIITSIVHETIDGEVVIANLDNGNYYSLQGTATEIWELMKNNISFEQILTAIHQSYTSDNDQMIEHIRNFLAELKNEELIEVNVENCAQNQSKSLTETNNRKPFTEPKLEKFTDMQSLLMIDPIHEVDVSTGWPNKSEDK
jgi:hypothetical protein